MLILQLTDFHAVPRGTMLGEVDTREAFSRLIARVSAFSPRPDLIVVSGDVGETGSDEEYAFVAEGLRSLGVPFVIVPGNHDVREPLRRAFAAEAGTLPDRLDTVREFGGVRFVCLDTLREGYTHGELSEDQLRWLETGLDEAAQQPTIIVMHHPPIETGLPVMDAIGLNVGRDALARILAGRGNILGILCGHIHRAISGRFAGIGVMVAPSASHQFALNFTEAKSFKVVREPPQVMLHRVGDTGLASYVLPL